MKNIDGRLGKLEHQLGLSPQGPKLLFVVTDCRPPAIDADACVKLLDEAGFLATSGIGVVNLMDFPPGMSAAETERYVRDDGAKICGSPLPKIQ